MINLKIKIMNRVNAINAFNANGEDIGIMNVILQLKELKK